MAISDEEYLEEHRECFRTVIDFVESNPDVDRKDIIRLMRASLDFLEIMSKVR